MTAPVRIRDAHEDDMGFVVTSWLESFKHSHGSRIAKIAPLCFDTFIGAHIRKLTRERDAHIVVACDVEDEDTLVGFAASSGDELHYVYIRKDMRGHGFARELVSALPVRKYTFQTPEGDRRLKPRERGWAFQPRYTL